MHHPDLICAIIPAAGYSSRMGRFKPLLPLGDKSLIHRTIHLFRSAGIENVFVVTGHRRRLMTPVVCRLGAHPVENRAYADGMLSSIQTGLRQLPRHCKGFFILPVDIPLVRPHTISRLLAAFERCPEKIHYPGFLGRRGHPPLVPGHLIPGILNWRRPGGLRAFLDRCETAAVDVPAADRFILRDLDTPETYARAKDWVRRYHIPDERECRALMDECLELPAPLVAHCRAVAATAARLAGALADAGCQIDVDLVRAGALVHDLARQEPDHAAAGARRLAAMGFQAVAEIVARHMDLSATGQPPSLESEVVYLADKLTRGTETVSLDRRFASSLGRYGHLPDAVAEIKVRRRQARAVQERIETRIKQPLPALLA